MRCRVCIKGHLDPSWQGWFEHLDILPDASGRTILCGALRDQAELYRILLKIRSLGFVLLSLDTDEYIEDQEER